MCRIFMIVPMTASAFVNTAIRALVIDTMSWYPFGDE